MSAVSIKRMMRTAKTADSSGNEVMAELQAKLKGRREEPPSFTPMKLAGRAKSEKQLLLHSVNDTQGVSGRTKWHIKPPSSEEGASPSESSKGSSKNIRTNLPPPPKTPPPILANKIHPVPSDSSSLAPKPSLLKSLSAVPTSETDSKPTSSADNSKKRKDSFRAPRSSSNGTAGVKNLARFFTGSSKNKREAEKAAKMNKTSSEPKDLGFGVSLEGSQQKPDLQQDIPTQHARMKGSSSSESSDMTSSLEVRSTSSANGYQNVFDDEAFARFDKRVPSPQDSDSFKRNRKPKPLPRKNSISNQPLFSTSSIEQPSGNTMHSTEMTTSPEIEIVALPSLETGITSLQELEDEIELLVDIANLPSRLSQLPSSGSEADNKMLLPKTEVTKTMSHNPVGSIPIKRRNTPQERREMRNGVCSDGEEFEDDYIPMNPIPITELSATLHHHPADTLTSGTTDPRSSAYYLKILPSDSPNPFTGHEQPPKSPGNDYIDMETLRESEKNDLESSPLPLYKPGEPMKSKSTTSYSLGSHGRMKVNSSRRFERVNYSEVSVASRSETDGKPKNLSEYGRSRSETKPPDLSALGYREVFVVEEEQKPQRSGTPKESVQASKTSDTSELGKEPVKFTDRPLPPTPKENPYYITYNGNFPSPLAIPASRSKWHEYVEITEEEIEKMSAASFPDKLRRGDTPPEGQRRRGDTPPEVQRRRGDTPPEVPMRPENFERLVDRKIIPSVEYSYAAIPGQTLFGLHWMNFHARNVLERTPPPPPPPFPPPENPRLQSVSSPPRYVENRPPTPPPKSDSLLREQGLIPAYVGHTPSPYLIPMPTRRKMSSPDAFNLNMVRRIMPSPSAHANNDKAEVRKRRRTPPPRPDLPAAIRMKLVKPMMDQKPHANGLQQRRQHQKVSRQRSQSTGELHLKRSVLRQSKSYAPDVTPDTDKVPERPALPPRKRKKRKAGFHNKIDRRSLAVIMQNKEAISRQLSKAGTAELNHPEEVPPPASQNQGLVRSLGEILLEIDALLRNEVCTEEDLLTAIEERLDIRLQSGSRKNSRDESVTGSPADQITDQDVEDVVSYMEDNRLQSPEEETQPQFPQSFKPRSDTVIVNDQVPTNNPETTQSPSPSQQNVTPEKPHSPGFRGSRSFSAGHLPLRRVNAKRRPSNTVDNLLTTNSSTYCNGAGVFTHKGGKLTNLTSGVVIEIPEGAVSKGRSQRVWFEIMQPVHEVSERHLSRKDLASTASQSDLESHFREKQDKRVQLTPLVLVGPCDAVFLRPIKIKIPHCLPYRNNAWHLHLQARAQNSVSEDWVELSNSSGIIIQPSKLKRKVYKNSTYQMHLEYALVKTKQLGCFKLSGTPIRNGTHTAKKMIASVYTSKESAANETMSLEVVMANSILDQIQVSAQSMCAYVCMCVLHGVSQFIHSL